MKCPICNFNVNHMNKKCGAYSYYKCNHCEHIILDIPDVINMKYQKEYRIKMAMKGDIKNNKLTDIYYRNRQGILKRRILKINKYINSYDSIFDIGCGGGYLLKYYQDKGYSVKGIEVDNLSINASKKIGIECIKGDFLTTDIENKYDVVMAWHSLEHVTNINTFMERMLNITNDNGIIIIEIPTNRGLKLNWNSYDGHAHYFSKKSLQELTNKFNLICLKIIEGIQKPAWLYIGNKGESAGQ